MNKDEASFQRVKHSTSSFVRTCYTAESGMTAKNNINTGINHHQLWLVRINGKTRLSRPVWERGRQRGMGEGEEGCLVTFGSSKFVGFLSFKFELDYAELPYSP